MAAQLQTGSAPYSQQLNDAARSPCTVSMGSRKHAAFTCNSMYVMSPLPGCLWMLLNIVNAAFRFLIFFICTRQIPHRCQNLYLILALLLAEDKEVYLVLVLTP